LIEPGRRTPKKFHSLIDPARPISAGARAVNGITDEMVRGKPSIGEVIPRFLDFINGSVLVAYNAGFDLGFIESSLGDRIGALDGYRIIDALSLSRRLFADLPRYNLASVAGSLGIDTQGEHRALSDAMMTWRIFDLQLKRLAEMGIEDVQEVSSPAARTDRASSSKPDPRRGVIESAILANRCLRIVYRSSWNNAVTSRIVTPRRIQTGFDREYLVAHCHERGAERNFRIDCIVSVDPAP
jgi:DNA polymerase III epsilon subunit family exonuclease